MTIQDFEAMKSCSAECSAAGAAAARAAEAIIQADGDRAEAARLEHDARRWFKAAHDYGDMALAAKLW